MQTPNVEILSPPADPKPWEAIADGEFAIVELFGHTTLIGRIAEVERFGVKMLAIEPLFNGALLGTVFHGGATIYRLTPCSREVAWERQPREDYQLPPAVRAIVPPALLPAPVQPPARYRPDGEPIEDHDDDEDHGDLDDDDTF